MVQIFDPIRVVMVEGKVNDWFDYKRKWGMDVHAGNFIN